VDFLHQFYGWTVPKKDRKAPLADFAGDSAIRTGPGEAAFTEKCSGFDSPWLCCWWAGSRRGSEKAMTSYFIIKYLHLLGAIVILGTGAGIAFFMLMAHRSRDPAFIARTTATVVIADMLFTLTAVVLQPVTGGLLMALSATALAERWLLVSLGLYAVAGLFWVPVIFMQIEMRDLARVAATQRASLPPRYFTLFHRWFWFGIPGFSSVMIILWLMIAKPL
jgi:uncharacterized membrane protein